MTIREVTWRIQEEQKRENRAMERHAQLACWLLNEHRKRKDQLKVHNLVRMKTPHTRDDG